MEPQDTSRFMDVTPGQVRWRKGLGAALKWPIHGERKVEGDGLSRAKESVKNGSGLVIIYNHYGKKDGFHVAREIVVNDEVLVEKPSVWVITENEAQGAIHAIEEHANFHYPPIITRDTLKREGYKHRQLNEGVMAFQGDAVEALNGNGSVAIAIDPGRREFLSEEPEEIVVGSFLAGMKRKNVSNFGVLLVGLSEPDREHYALEDVGGLGLFRKQRLVTGPYFTLPDLMEHPEVHGNFRNVDRFLRGYYRGPNGLVNDAYLHAPNDESRKRQKEKDSARKIALARNAVIFTAGAAAIGGALYHNAHKRTGK